MIFEKKTKVFNMCMYPYENSEYFHQRTISGNRKKFKLPAGNNRIFKYC